MSFRFSPDAKRRQKGGREGKTRPDKVGFSFECVKMDVLFSCSRRDRFSSGGGMGKISLPMCVFV